MTGGRREDDRVDLEILDDENALTKGELAVLKQLAANYKAAKIGVTGAVAVGGFITAVYHGWQWLNGLRS